MMPHDYNAPRRSNNNPIAIARLAKGMTQEQLAMEIGVDQRQVSEWENGRFNVPIPMMLKIAKILDIDWVDYISNQAERKKHSAISEARKAKGLTQTEFAKAIGLSQSLVSKYETGAYPVPQEALIHIAEVLDVPIESLAQPEGTSGGEKGPK